MEEFVKNALENWELVFLGYLKYLYKLDTRVTKIELKEEVKKELENA